MASPPRSMASSPSKAVLRRNAATGLIPHDSRKQEKVLLHGILHIKIIRGIDLINLDGIRSFKSLQKFAPSFMTNDISDPFVEVATDHDRLVKTRVINNDLNPVWDESFYVPVAHYTKGLTFSVYDMDSGNSTELIGTTYLPAEEFVQFDKAAMNQLYVFVQRTSELHVPGVDAPRGKLEYFVRLLPSYNACNILSSPIVPGVYFKHHNHNRVKLYVNADDGDDMAPVVRYGGANNDSKIWNPPRLWRDIYDAICAAEFFIYITGWAIDTSQSLLRGEEREEAEKNGKYSPIIGELLKQKAEEGVTVNILVWDDATSMTSTGEGIVGTHDEITKKFFEKSKVTLRLAPMKGDTRNVLKEKIAKFLMFTHHQKTIILDASCESDPHKRREPLAFVGGIDLTNGRWDNRKHPLFRSLDTDHKGDFYSGCFKVKHTKIGPRQPWHDIHSSVRGPAAMDVIQNFTERWSKQAKKDKSKLLNMEALFNFDEIPKYLSEEAWCSQVLRSIDARTVEFDKHQISTFGGDDVQINKASDPKQTPNERLKSIINNQKEKLKELTQIVKPNGDYSRSFIIENDQTFSFTSELVLKKGRYVDMSMHRGWVHHIRRAQHTLYIESQYFLGSSQLWPVMNDTKCGNLIPGEVTFKICEKIKEGGRFSAYILLPLWPEGIPESSLCQAILYWQKLTIEAMYRHISDCLTKLGREESPRDYLNFYALATRETEHGSRATMSPRPWSDEAKLFDSRRHQVYVHSKMMIADDAVAIVGSANINQRSMDGARDSEIAVASFQPAYMPTETSVPHGDVHGFRLHCWATIMNKMEDVFKTPNTIECVRRVNAIAEENWDAFIEDEPNNMDSHLIPYPIEIEADGTVKARAGTNGVFPDTKASITGSKSRTLPEILTT